MSYIKCLKSRRIFCLIDKEKSRIVNLIQDFSEEKQAKKNKTWSESVLDRKFAIVISKTVKESAVKISMLSKNLIFIAIISSSLILASCGEEKKKDSGNSPETILTDKDSVVDDADFNESENDEFQEDDADKILSDNDIHDSDSDNHADTDEISDEVVFKEEKGTISLLHDINTTKIRFKYSECTSYDSGLFCHDSIMIDKNRYQYWNINKDKAEYIGLFDQETEFVTTKSSEESVTYFVADNAIWKSDGTKKGSIKVFEGEPDIYILSAGGYIFFTENRFANDAILYSLNIETNEVTELKTFDTLYPVIFKAIGDENNIYIKISDLESGNTEFWKSDGTKENTEKIIDNTDREIFYFFKNSLFFQAKDHSLHAYSFDSGKISNILKTDGIAYYDSLDAYFYGITEKFLYFTISTNFYRTDGTAENTVLITENNFGTLLFEKNSITFGEKTGEKLQIKKLDDSSSTPLVLTEFTADDLTYFYPVAKINESIYFEKNWGSELLKLNGSKVETVNFEGEPIFINEAAAVGNMIYVITESGKLIIITPDEKIEAVENVNLKNYGILKLSPSDLYLKSEQNNNYSDKTILRIDTISKKITPLYTSSKDALSSTPRLCYTGSSNNTIYFTSEASDSGAVLFSTQGESESLLQISTSEDFNDNNYLTERFTTSIEETDDAVYYTEASVDFSYNLAYTFSLMRRDKISGEAKVIMVNEQNDSNSDSFKDINIIGKLDGKTIIFQIANLDKGIAQIWRTDGTDAGTYLLKEKIYTNINTFWEFLALQQRPLTQNGKLYFIAADTEREISNLWQTDGTVEGTSLVNELSKFATMIMFKDEIYFAGINEELKLSLFKISKESGKPEKITDKTTPYPDVILSLYAISNNMLYIINSNKLWQSDGTDEGTTLLLELDKESFINEVYFSEKNIFLYTLAPMKTEVLQKYNPADKTMKFITEFSSPDSMGMGLYPIGVINKKFLYNILVGGSMVSTNKGYLHSFDEETEIDTEIGLFLPLQKTGNELLLLNENSLLRTDGTIEGTYKLTDSESDVIPTGLIGVKGEKIIFSGYSRDFGEELFVYEPSEK